MKPPSSKSFSASPLLVSIVYAVVSVVWIVFSDRLVRHLAATPDTMTRWSIIKGSLFVSLSAVLIYFLMERISTANRNLTDKVKSQTEALQKSADRYRRVLETAPEGVWTVDRHGRTEFVNQRMGSMLGFRAEETVGRDLLDYVDPDWQKIAAESFRQPTFSAGPVELKFRRKDGSEMWGSAYRGTLFDELGQYDGAVSQVSDISDRKRAEEQLRLQATALQAAANAIVITDAAGTILSVNPAFTTLTGYRSDEVIGKNPRILKSGEHNAAFYKSLWSAITEGKVWHGEMVNRHKSGRLYHEEMTIAPVRSSAGAVSHFIAIQQNITARKRAEREILVSTRQQAAVADLGLFALACKDLSLVLEKAVGAVAQTLDVEFSKVLQLLPDGEALLLRAGVGWHQGLVGRATVSAGTSSQAGYTLLRSEPVIVDEGRTETRFTLPPLLREHNVVSGISVPIRGQVKPFGVLGAHTQQRRTFTSDDANFLQSIANLLAQVIERDQAEETLQRQALIIENSTQLIGLASPEGQMLYLNNAGRKLVGIGTAEDITKRKIADFVFDEDTSKVGEVVAALMQHKHWKGEFRLKHAQSGQAIPVEQYAFPVPDPATGEIFSLANISHDITERKQAEESLRQSEEKFLKAFQSSPDAISISRVSDGRYVEVNEGYVRLFGRTRKEAIGQTALDLKVWENPADRRQLVAQLEREGSIRNLECSFRRKSGEIWRGLLSAEKIELAAEPCLLAVIRDVTEQTKLELQLRQAQKLEAVGRLAGGVAHDFNNMLGVILGYGDILQTQLPPGHPGLASAAEMQKAARRAGDLTRQLLAFSRKQIMQPQVLNLNSLLGELNKMLRRLIGADIELVFRPGQEVARVKADPGQLEQVVMNLAVNAKDAMPGGGRFVIETANVEVDADFAHRHAPMLPGPYVLLSATDTGSGMTPETLSHIFEPFFTTKEQGKGTGLGLSIVYGIVKQSGGFIWVDSEPNQGSAFRIYLPPTAEAEATIPSPSPRFSSLEGTETILVAEDDASVREMIRIVLAAAGYTILEARNGAEALALLRDTSKSVHLLLADIIMPGKMNGWELARSAATSQPNIRTLFMTGFGGELDSFGIAIAPDVMLITKPFSADLLLRKIREALDSPTGTKSASTSS